MRILPQSSDRNDVNNIKVYGRNSKTKSQIKVPLKKLHNFIWFNWFSCNDCCYNCSCCCGNQKEKR